MVISARDVCLNLAHAALEIFANTKTKRIGAMKRGMIKDNPKIVLYFNEDGEVILEQAGDTNGNQEYRYIFLF